MRGSLLNKVNLFEEQMRLEQLAKRIEREKWAGLLAEAKPKCYGVDGVCPCAPGECRDICYMLECEPSLADEPQAEPGRGFNFTGEHDHLLDDPRRGQGTRRR